MENNLPEGWCTTTFDDLIIHIIGGDWGNDLTETFSDELIKAKVIRGTDYRNWSSIRSRNAPVRLLKKSSVEKRRLIHGDIVLEVSGGGPDQPVGRTIIIDTQTLNSELLPIVCSNFFRQIRLTNWVDPFYVHYYLIYAYYLGRVNEFQTQTTNLRNLNVNDFIAKSIISLAPLPEQHRIVAKLDALMERAERNKQRLDKIPALLKRFRQSVLAAAVSGRLTEGWRREHWIDDDWEEDELGNLTSLVTSGSRGWAQYYSDSGSIFVRAQNISQDVLDLDDIAYVKLSNPTEGIRTLIKKDDILVTITGANVTKTAHVGFDITDAYVNQHVALVRLKDTSISKFIYFNLISVLHGRRQLQLMAYGQGKPQLNLDNIKSVMILLPSPMEATEIVRRVEQLFAFADKIEARYAKAKAMLDRLPQSILAKAFRGELVPQDPEDEPAEVLLERVRAERGSIGRNKMKRDAGQQK